MILCGGRSSRMGSAKALLPFGDEPMLARVVRLLGEVAPRRVVVAATGQELPELPADVQIVCDRREGEGPLEGLAVGLAALESRVDAAYVTGCDVPLLVPQFVTRMFEALVDRATEYDIAVPVEAGRHHPLAAVYRPPVAAVAERLLRDDRRRPFFLFQEVPTREVPVETLRDIDPDLATLANLNRPEDYRAALVRAGLEPRA